MYNSECVLCILISPRQMVGWHILHFLCNASKNIKCNFEGISSNMFYKASFAPENYPPRRKRATKKQNGCGQKFPPKKTWQHKPKMMLLQQKKRMKAILTKTMCKLTSNLLDVSDPNHAKLCLLPWLKSLSSNVVKWKAKLGVHTNFQLWIVVIAFNAGHC